MKQWRGVLFTDESRFTLFLPGRSASCIPTSQKRFADTCVDETDRFGGGSIMVRGDIAHGVKSHLIAVEGNIKE